MKFNYRLAAAKSQLEFLSEWLALEKEFIPLFSNLRKLGNQKFIDDIYKLVYTGDISSLNAMISPQQLSKIPQTEVNNYVSSISSIISIVQRASQQPIFQQLLNLINTKDKNKKTILLENLTTNLADDLSTYFSDAIIQEIRGIPGLLPVLLSGRVGMGAQMGMPETRMTVDQLDNQMSGAFANDMSFATNFMNMLSTLLHRSTISRKTLNTLMPDSDNDVQITPQQDFAFITMCASGADPDSRKAQYDVIKWIEATENFEGTGEISFDNNLPKFKELDMIKRAADIAGEKGFAAQGYDYADFCQTYEKLKNSDNKIKEIQAILLGKIPPIYQTLFTSAQDIAKLSPEQQELYKEQYPEIGEVLGNDGLKIRTTQLLMVKNAVTQAWGTHVKRFFEATQNVFPTIDNDNFVELMFLDDDTEIRAELLSESKNSSIDISSIVQSNNEHEIVQFRDSLNLENSSKLFGLLNRLIKIIRSRNEFLSSTGITDVDMFNEVILQKNQLLDMTNIFGNIPPVAKLWNSSAVINGKHIMDPSYTGEITRSDILTAGGFNPLASNSNFEDAIRLKSKEQLEDYKNRMAELLRGLIEQGELYLPDGQTESPISYALKSQVGMQNPAIKAINMMVKSIIRAEQNLENFEDENFEEIISEHENLSETEIKARLDKKRVLEDLISRENLSTDVIGELNINPKSSPYALDTDPELAEAGLGTDSKTSSEVIKFFRNYFNLPICSYAIDVNSPNECAVNKNGFKLDFTILADKLLVNPDGTLKLKTNLLLTGETFGYDEYTGLTLVIDKDKLAADKEKRTKQIRNNARILQKYSNGLVSADGQSKIFLSEDGKQLMAEFPEKDPQGNETTRTEKADRYIEYKIRSSYKEPYETFLAAVIGADTIFVPAFAYNNQDQISRAITSVTEQLDNLSIVWCSARGTSKAYKLIQSYNGELDTTFDKYRSGIPVVPYTNRELYANSLLAQFDLQHIAIPYYNADKEQFKLETMVQYQKEYAALGQKLAATDVANLQLRHDIIVQMEGLQKKFNIIINRYNEFINSPITNETDEYRKDIIEKRRQILEIVGNSPNMTCVEIKAAIEGPLLKKKNVVNNVKYHTFPPSVLTRVAAAFRWWKNSVI